MIWLFIYKRFCTNINSFRFVFLESFFLASVFCSSSMPALSHPCPVWPDALFPCLFLCPLLHRFLCLFVCSFFFCFFVCSLFLCLFLWLLLFQDDAGSTLVTISAARKMFELQNRAIKTPDDPSDERVPRSICLNDCLNPCLSLNKLLILIVSVETKAI